MTTAELESIVHGVALIALVVGVLGAMCWDVFKLALGLVFEFLERRHDQATRIRDARWRAQWNKALREARASGYHGPRAVAFAANSMRTRRAAIAELKGL